jgi:3-isopropylmalate/(R)-2-methylmalate dehydratase small subunit
MEPLLEIEGVAVALNRANVDTDQIIPARFIMKPRQFDYATVLFRDNFPSHWTGHKGAKVLVTGENFACGSAREQAVWALQDWGFRVIIAPSFGGIFYANCMKNGVLPAIVDAEVAEELCGMLESAPGTELWVSLREQVIRAGDRRIHFVIAESHKAQLLSGKDDITRTLEHEAAIVAHENAASASAKWSRPSFDEAVGSRRHIPVAKA